MDSDREALVFGSGVRDRIVAVEWAPSEDGDSVILFSRVSDRVREERIPFEPFLWVSDESWLSGGPDPVSCRACEGDGFLKVLARFRTWADLQHVLHRWRRDTGVPPSARAAPYFFLSDPVQQFLTASGETFFRHLPFGDLRRMQVDIETRTGDGYDFPNAERETDEILAVGLSDTTGWAETFSRHEDDEKTVLEKFVHAVRERDPDVIEGHNIFGFDFPYLIERARRHQVPLQLGRDGSLPRVRSGRFNAGERVMTYPKTRLFGRTVVDTYFLAQAYDTIHRSLPGLGLKEVARHFGLAREDRTYIRGSRISKVFDEEPDRVLRYLRDDLDETRGLGDLFAPVYVAQARLLPLGFQEVCLRGQAAKIESLLLRACLHVPAALPRPGEPESFQGGYTDLFRVGVVRQVHHCDVRSLYPSIMLTKRIGPSSDAHGFFLALLDTLRCFRLEAKAGMQAARDPVARREADTMQSTYKLLINSFYGYLGFEQARFCDFDAAASVTSEGRALLQHMIAWIREQGGEPIEIDTDGIYFVPPDTDEAGLKVFRRGLAASLPEGIDIEFDGEYESMFSYKRKNYALRTSDGEILITGAALKSRGLEPFQRAFVRDWIDALLAGCPEDRAVVIERYRRAILDRQWDIRKLAKSERLSEAPEAYVAKRVAGSRARNAALELALASNRTYQVGDTVSYYVTGEKKSVPVHSHAKLVSAWDPNLRDENVAYYTAKLDALAKKFESAVRSDDARQGTLELS